KAPPPALSIFVPSRPTWSDDGRKLLLPVRIANNGRGASTTPTRFDVSAPTAEPHAPVAVGPLDPSGFQNHPIIPPFPHPPQPPTLITLTLQPASGETGTAGDNAHRTTTT